EPIRKEDIAPSDPLMLKVTGAKVLDIANAGASRDVINFTISPFEEGKDDITSSLISFDFLDYQDGATIRVLTDRRRAFVGVTGTIIGMPEGIQLKGDIEKHPILNKVGCSLAILLQLAGIAGSIYVFRRFTGGWADLWPFLLPLAVLIFPLLIIAISSSMWPKGKQWKLLRLPRWFVLPEMRMPEHRYYYDHYYDPEEVLLMREVAEELPDKLKSNSRQGDA
ncbi:MAG TPA: hypothetical protein VE732_00840, partial [Nitrososphaera sp.]|nr:hypothetical protein [Nitrososphaera sp.]